MKYYKDLEKQVQFLISVLEIDKDSKGIDLGCGEGLHLKELYKITKFITGIDIINYPDNPNFVKLDFFEDKLPFKNLDFAYILAPYLDEKWWKIEKLLKNINQTLKPNGSFILDLFYYNFMKNNSVKQNFIIEKDRIILSKFIKEMDRVNLDRTIVNLKDKSQKNFTGSWRVFEFNELSEILNQNGFYIYKQYADFDINKALSWNNDKLPERLIIHCKKYTI